MDAGSDQEHSGLESLGRAVLGLVLLPLGIGIATWPILSLSLMVAPPGGADIIEPSPFLAMIGLAQIFIGLMISYAAVRLIQGKRRPRRSFAERRLTLITLTIVALLFGCVAFAGSFLRGDSADMDAFVSFLGWSALVVAVPIGVTMMVWEERAPHPVG